MYCGDVVEISQPLLPIGIKTPTSMDLPPENRSARQARKRDAKTGGRSSGFGGSWQTG